MRDALRAQDQQLYFRILTRVDLLLPVAGPAPAGPAAAGWGTWTTGGRTHVLAFTSVTAMRACLGGDAGATRRVPYADLAAGWPNHEWWLAVNPGLPIEGYLPAWFVAQLSRGDVRLPGRTMGARARLERVEKAARPRPDAPGRDVPPAAVPPAAVPPQAGASTGQAPSAPAGRVPGEPATVPFPAVPGTPTRAPVPGRAEPSVPPAVPRRPDPANGQLTAERLARLGPREVDEGATRDGWSGRVTSGDPARRAGDLAAPVERVADRPDPGPAPDSLAGWVSDLRRRQDEPDPFDTAARSGTPNGRSAPPPARSFFEPASGRTARRPSPLDQPHQAGDRAVPPSRFAQGTQPFPRRRPLHEPVPEDPTQAFPMDAAEATPALGPSRPEEPPRPFRPAPPPASAAEATQALPRRRPQAGDASDVDEPTQPIPAGDDRSAVPPEAEELPPSIAEPVSGPPAGRRGFSPIVIEGTIIEARDLTGPVEAPTARAGAGAGPVVPEAYAVPTVPAAASAMATATAPPAYGADGEGHAEPWAGPAEPTVPFHIDPAARESRSEPTVPAARPAETTDVPASAAEPTAPLSGGSATADRPPFEPVAPTGEPTEPLLDASASAERPLFEPAGPAQRRTEPPYPRAAAVADRTEPLSAPAVPFPDERTEPLSTPAVPFPDERTEPLSASAGRPTAVAPPAWTAPSGDRAAQLSAPDERPTATPSPAAPLAWTAPTPRPTDGTPPADPVLPGHADPVPGGHADPVPGGHADPVPGAEPGPAAVVPAPADFVPANEVEEELLGAVGSGSTDGFLSTLLLARVLLPVAAESAAGSRPGDPGFVWHTEQLDGGPYVVVYTSPERLADRADGPVDTVRVKFVQLIRRWPDESWSFAVNPGTPVGATYPGEQVLALANWAAEVGLGDDPEGDPEPAATGTTSAETRPAPPPVDPTRPVTMQKAVAPSQLAYYLERGYDRVSGFVHRANELAHLGTPAELYDALGLGYPDTPFSRDAEEIYVLRWPAYRPSLYRIPYGGQNEAAMRAMEGWVIERPPFRGNGFAPGESSDVVAEFKVDSARLPHGAQLWRIGADRSERVVATLDTDALLWRRVGAP
ncbi:hypothetical protein G3554_00535 [Micromonospora sp. PPF5-17]|nr:hypothetical protein [Micromonospora sp. PPF5-17B]NES34658.1 hypothetical protein [Micromonospora solifontis]NES57174.1 hypothetical protein [Micromonospora sp. PPF5-6]